VWAESEHFGNSKDNSALDVKLDIKFPWKAIWRVKAPRRVSFFLWSAAWGRILTCDNLMRRGYIMARWCCMCRHDGETGNHLLIHCTLASDLWHVILRSFGVLWVFPNNIADLLFGWFNCFGKPNSSVWNLVPLCLKMKSAPNPSWRKYFLGFFLIGLGSGVLPWKFLFLPLLFLLTFLRALL
jgi:hypothetical protein